MIRFLTVVIGVWVLGLILVGPVWLWAEIVFDWDPTGQVEYAAAATWLVACILLVVPLLVLLELLRADRHGR